MKIVAKILAVAVTLFLVTNYHLISGFSVPSFEVGIVVALVLGVLNILIRPLLLIFTLPVNILSLGLFTFVINALLFWLASFFVKGFEVSGFVAAFLGALIVSVVNWLVNRFLD